MSQVIARRYRPQGFDEVIGQEPIIRTLRQAIASGRVAHGYIFSGHRGIGKTTVARILAKALNCRAVEAPTPTPCGECDACREIRDGSAVDVIEVDAASNRGIDEIRALRERVRYRPARDRYKVFILDEAHQLTGDAFNALLKTLEEPPEWAVFVLATTEPEALPPTIRSRCQHFAFRAVPFATILCHLESICGQENVAAEREALELIAEAGEGSVRDALSILDQAMTYGGDGITAEAARALLGRVGSQHIRGLLEAVKDGSSRDVLARADQLLAAGVGPAPLCWQLTQAVRNALVAQCSPDMLEAGGSERATAVEAASWFREEDLARFLQILLRAAGSLRFGQQERLHLELALIQMLHARRLSSLEDVLASLRGEPGETARVTTGTHLPKAAPRPAPAPPRPVAAPAPRPTPVRSSPAQPIPAQQPAPSKSSPSPAAHAAAAPAPSVEAADPFATLPESKPSPAVAPAAEPAPPPTPIDTGSDPTAAILRHLEQSGKASLLSIVSKAEWRWAPDGNLELIFAGASAAMSALVDQASTRKTLGTALTVVLRRSPEVTITARPDAPDSGNDAAAGSSAVSAPPPPGSPEERAERHPLVREIRARIPGHVLKTRSLSS